MIAGKNKIKRKSTNKDPSETSTKGSQDLSASCSSASSYSSSSVGEQKRSKPASPPLIPTIEIPQIELEDSVIDAPLNLPNIILEDIIMVDMESQSVIPSIVSEPVASTSAASVPFLPGVDMVFDQPTQALPTFDVETGEIVSIGDPTWNYKCKLDEQKPEPAAKWDNSPRTESLIDGEQIAYDTFLGFFQKSWKKKEGPPTRKKYMKIMRYYRKKGAPDTAPLECFAFDVPVEYILTGCVKYCTLVKKIEKKWPGLLREEQKKAQEQKAKK